MREALIVWGGWSGHEPERCAGIVRDMLEQEGFKARVENTTEAFADPGYRRHESGRADRHGVEDREASARESDARQYAAASVWPVSTAACAMPSAKRPNTSSCVGASGLRIRATSSTTE